jgi:HK97 gp10 family phage protein
LKNGDLAATYYPGNLRRSIKTIVFRNNNTDVFVGPKVRKGQARGDFKGNRVDAYYAHMVEKGTSKQPPQFFMRKSFDSTKNVMKAAIITYLKGKYRSAVRGT